MPHKDPEVKNKYMVRWYARPENKERICKRRRHQTVRVREQIFDLLGRECKRCGFADTRALQVDHVYGDGAKERGHGRHQRLKAVKLNPERYQILCANCNWIKRIENNEQNAVKVVPPNA